MSKRIEALVGLVVYNGRHLTGEVTVQEGERGCCLEILKTLRFCGSKEEDVNSRGTEEGILLPVS